MKEFLERLRYSWPIVTFAIAQLLYVLIWSVKMEDRMTTLEQSQSSQDKRIEGLFVSANVTHDQLLVIGERQRVVIENLAANSKKIDSIIESLSHMQR